MSDRDSRITTISPIAKTGVFFNATPPTQAKPLIIPLTGVINMSSAIVQGIWGVA